MNPFRTLTPLQMRERALARAERDLVEAQQLAEYYSAMEALLQRQVHRLRNELAEQPRPMKAHP